MDKINNRDTKDTNIILIGFMGAGKSAIAKILGKKLYRNIIDTDQEIVRRTGKTIPKLFEEYGETYFRDLETTVLQELKMKNDLIISCGGGIVLRDENIQIMQESGKVFLLTATPETTYERVKKGKNRPLLNDHMSVEYIKNMMEQRQERYEKAAHIKVATDHKHVEMIANEIIEQL